MISEAGIARSTAEEAPMRLPVAADLTACNPLPSMRSLWPGRTERAVVSSVTPRNIDGIKSRNEWVTAAETIEAETSNAECAAGMPISARKPPTTE